MSSAESLGGPAWHLRGCWSQTTWLYLSAILRFGARCLPVLCLSLRICKVRILRSTCLLGSLQRLRESTHRKPGGQPTVPALRALAVTTGTLCPGARARPSGRHLSCTRFLLCRAGVGLQSCGPDGAAPKSPVPCAVPALGSGPSGSEPELSGARQSLTVQGLISQLRPDALRSRVPESRRRISLRQLGWQGGSC